MILHLGRTGPTSHTVGKVVGTLGGVKGDPGDKATDIRSISARVAMSAF